MATANQQARKATKAAEKKTEKQQNNDFSVDFSCDFAASDAGLSDLSIKVRDIEGLETSFKSLKKLQDSKDFGQIMTFAQEGKLLFIEYGIRAFINKQNANYMRPNDGQLAKAARMSKGKTLFENHSTHNVGNEKGVVIEASASTDGGKEALDYRVSARDPEFQVQFLRGMRRKYSASFVPKNPTCSACGSSVRLTSYGYARFSCNHERGEMQSGKPVEIRFDIADVREISAVGVGAVSGAQALGATYSEAPNEEEVQMDYEVEYNKVVAELNTLKTQKEASDTLAFSLRAERDAALAATPAVNTADQEVAAKYAQKYLEGLRVIIGTDDAQVANFKNAVKGFGGVEGAVAFYEKLAPQLNYTSQEAGTAAAVDAAGSQDKLLDTKVESKEDAPISGQMIDGTVAYSLSEAAGFKEEKKEAK